ncbi:MAG TPA: hypothetical protein DCE56_20220 [Cyanobacteria bacterium UBA8553]|nr:hypothetical protein [Cyanobacteria bacterium UBA8553]HAJ58520.1 hypothetical protein [Cyanobacteria bacterium UBA8543]
MTNPFALLCQTDLNRILRRDRCKISDRIPLPDEEPGNSTTSPKATPRLAKPFVSTIGWAAGVALILTGCSSKSVPDSVSLDSPTPTPSVSSISSEQVDNYAKAVLAIEPIRQEAYEEIEKLSNNEKVSEITCNQPETIKALDQSIQTIAVNYCKKAKQFIQDQSLTVTQFNEITNSSQSDAELRARIQNKLLNP